MKTTSTPPARVSLWLHLVCCLGVCPALSGCGGILDQFDSVEDDASQYGTVAVGAPQVIDYNDNSLQQSRKRLLRDVQDIRKNLRTIYGTSPQVSPAGASATDPGTRGKKPKDAAAKAPKPARDKPRGSTSTTAQGAQENKPESSTSTAAPSPQPSEVDLIAARMAALKFLEAEIADIDISEAVPVPCGFHRYEVSLDCSAWVCGSASAVLVEIDVYPYMADSWCYEAAQVLKEVVPQVLASQSRKCHTLAELSAYATAGTHCATHWKEVIRGLGEFCTIPSECFSTERLFERIDANQPVGYYVARWHNCLDDNKLRPRIVHVARMSRAEYQILSESTRATSNYELGLAYSAASAKLGGETEKQISKLMATVQPVNLAFVAGGQRAGWLFMPGKTTEGRMSPTERRLKMAIDVPEGVSKLGIHIQKIFLDSDLRILSDSALAKQMAGYQKTRALLDEAEELYPDDQPGGTDYRKRCYRLVKTRMRNSLYQGWPEEIPVEIPRENQEKAH